MKVVLRLFSYVKYHWRLFFLGNLLLLISVALNLIMPRVGKYILDDIISVQLASGNFVARDLVKALILFSCIGVSSAILRYFASFFLVKSSNRFTEKLRNEVYEHIHKMPISYFDTVPAGTIVSRITNDTETIRQSFYINVFANMLIAAVQIIGIYIALFLARWEIALAMLVLLPGMWVFKNFYQKHATKSQAEIRELYGQVNGSLNEIVKNVSLAQSYGQEKRVIEKFETLTDAQMQVTMKFTRFDWTMFNLPEVITRFLVFASISWVVYGHLELSMPVSAGFIYLIMEYVQSLFGPIASILDVLSVIIRSIVSAKRVFEVLDTETEENGDQILEEVEGNLSLENVVFSYIEDRVVLNQVNFEALSGQTVAIVGPTGSGKSSLLNLLFRFYDPQAGKVLVDGIDVKELQRSSLRSHMGIVLQEPFLIEGTIYSNISLGNQDIPRQEAQEALERLGAYEVFREEEELLDVTISERGKNLSSGQRQLISFARALAYNPKILILDEATASIDTQTEQIIQHALDVLKQGRTTVIIAHRLSTIRDADVIYVLEDGKIVEKGSHKELLALHGKYQSMHSGWKQTEAVG